jgi:hypothetical protein
MSTRSPFTYRFEPGPSDGRAAAPLLHVPQVGGRDLVEAVVDLARVDEIAALTPADEEPRSRLVRSSH